MDGKEVLDGLQFHDDLAVHQKIDSIPFIKADALIDPWQRHRSIEGNPQKPQFMG